MRYVTWRRFPLSRNFYVRTHVNKTKELYPRSRENVKVEPRSTYTFRRHLSYNAFTDFIYARKNNATEEIHL